MAPVPNECINLLVSEEDNSADFGDASKGIAAHSSRTLAIPTRVKVSHDNDDEASDSDTTFFDATSELQSDDSSSNNKDSGSDDSPKEPDFSIPDEETLANIVKQVEMYFSDANIAKDAFLLKHVRRNREGYISLKLISSFKKVKHVTKDWRIVAYACKASQKLQINDVGTKVRRIDPLPDLDDAKPTRTILAMNIPADRATIEAVAELFAHYGQIALVRVVKPGSTSLPAEIRPYAAQHPEIHASVCALVEFEQSDAARSAVQASTRDLESTLKVVEVPVRREPKRRSKNSENKSDVSPVTSRPTTPAVNGSAEGRWRRGERKNTANASSDTPNHSSSENDERSPNIRRRQNGSASSAYSYHSTSLSSSPVSKRHFPQKSANLSNARSLVSSPEVQHRQKSASYSEPASPASLSPWVQRRMAAAAAGSYVRSSQPCFSNNKLTVPENVVRMPAGPDGTRGFHQKNNYPRSQPSLVSCHA